MQIPNQRVFSLNSAVTPEIQFGNLNPSTSSTNQTLANMPVGSMYIQHNGSPDVESAVLWVKVLSDIVAAQNAVSAWANVSQAKVTSGSVAPTFSSPEFLAYAPGTIYIHNEQKSTGTYRTAWMKVGEGGTRADWVSIAESTALEYVVAKVKATGLSIAITPSTMLVWRFPTTTTATTVENTPATANMILSDGRLKVPTNGIYLVSVSGWLYVTSASSIIYYGVALNGSTVPYMNTIASFPVNNSCLFQMCVPMRLNQNDVLGLAMAVISGSGSGFTLTNYDLSMQLIAP